MKIRNALILAVAIASGTAPALPAAPSNATADSRISVAFSDISHFTDFRRDATAESSPELAEQLGQFMREAGERVIPEGTRLDIKVTDVDLAGDLEPWRGPEFDHIRVIKSLYPPRIELEFRLTDSAGKVLKSGTRRLTDPAFQSNDAFLIHKDDYLRYEKNMLRDWFRSEFRSVKSGTS